MSDLTPDVSFVRELAAYDKKLRVRWARHSERWFIERQLDQRHPQLVSEMPAPESAKPVQRDLWEAWQQGYVHVLTVGPELLHWNAVADHLAQYDSWRQGGMQAINRQFDEKDEQWDKTTDRNIDNVIEAQTDDAYEHIAWASGRRVAMTEPEPPLVDSGLGFKVRDRRTLNAA